MASSDTKEFGATVPEEDYNFFKMALPQYGATQWFIRTALKRFNEQLKKSPSLLDQVDASISEMLKEGRDTATSENSAGAQGAKVG